MSDVDAQQWLDSNIPFISIYDEEMVNRLWTKEEWAVAVVAKASL